MKKILYLLSAVCLSFFVIMAVGCASTPEQPAEVPSETPSEVTEELVEEVVEPEAVEPVLPEEEVDYAALDALKAEADALRDKGLSFNVADWFTEDWQEAEDAYNRGVEAYGVSYDESESAFQDAIAKYREIEAEAVVFIKDTWDSGEKALEEIKQAAEDAGARGYYPEQFAMAENVEAEARASYDAFNETASPEELSNAFEKGVDALNYYTMLKTGMDIRDLRRKIIENSFDSEFSEEYAFAEEKYSEAVSAFGVDNEKAVAASDEALAAYEYVCSAGFEVLAMQEKTRSDEMKELCDSIKASRSMAPEYNEASEIYATAVSLGDSGDWEASYKTYRDAALYFAEIYQNVLYKKNVAEEAMNAAKAKQDASTALALEADKIAPLPDDYEENEAEGAESVESSADTGAVEPEDESVPENTEPGPYTEGDGEAETGAEEFTVYEGEEFTVTEESAESSAEEVGTESGMEYSVIESSTENAEVAE